MATQQAPTDDPIPLCDELSQIYSTQRLVKEGQRWDNLRARFKKTFGLAPQYIARAPGRVNLMGDHVDHMRFGCLPAALEMDILMAFHVRTANEDDNTEVRSSSANGCPTDDRLVFHLDNTTERFEPTTFETDVQDASSVELQHHGASRWANYFKVAYKGLHPHLPAHVLSARNRPTQVQVLVDGTIPPESSLSSSAAMTTCSSIVILEAFQARTLIGRREMAEVAIESERLVGVNSGGMDQAASIFGVVGNALHITFEPRLNAEPTQLPPSTPPHVLVIANTLVVSDKKVMGPVQYNLRVCELLMACRAIAHALNLPLDCSTRLLKPLTDVYIARNPITYDDTRGDVRKAWDNWGSEAAELVHMRDVALKVLPDGGQSRAQVEELTGLYGAAYDKQFLSQFPVRADAFELRKRVQHVFDESLHVLQFKFACKHGGPDAYAELGRIMHASQRSLFDVYENACPELRDVCAVAETGGALGSRPTGAGWGGSTVSLVEQGKVPHVVEALHKHYYQKRHPGLSDEAFADAVLISQPAQGACVYKV